MWMTTARTDISPMFDMVDVIVGDTGKHLIREPALLEEPLVVGFSARRVEVLEVGVDAERRVVHRLELHAGDPLTEPAPLDFRHVAKQPEQGKVGRLDGGHRQLVAGQAGALLQQRCTMPEHEAFEHRPLIAHQGAVGQGHFRSCPRHTRIITLQPVAPECA